MKKIINEFAEYLLSTEQMKALKGGGVYYCACGPNGEFYPVPDNEHVLGTFTCAQWCVSHGY